MGRKRQRLSTLPALRPSKLGFYRCRNMAVVQVESFLTNGDSIGIGYDESSHRVYLGWDKFGRAIRGVEWDLIQPIIDKEEAKVTPPKKES